MHRMRCLMLQVSFRKRATNYRALLRKMPQTIGHRTHLRHPVCWHARQYVQQTYIHAYIQTDKHTYISTYIHAYIHTYIHTYIQAYIHTYICSYMHACIHTYVLAYHFVRTYVAVCRCASRANSIMENTSITYTHTQIDKYIYTHRHTCKKT